MTPGRFFISRLGLVLGIDRKTQRMAELATETRLLRDAETLLGSAIWEHVEHLDDVSVEYWNLRKIQKKRTLIQQRMHEYQERIAKAHDERIQVLQTMLEPEQNLLEEKNRIVGILEDLGHHRDQIIQQAREIRRAYDGMKTKLEFLEESPEPKPAEIEKVKLRLTELRTRFSKLKEEREKIRARLEEGEQNLDQLNAELSQKNKGRRGDATEAFQAIGDANKEYTALRAELGPLETSAQQFQSEIGRHVSLHAPHDPACARIIAPHRSLVRILAALRQSIQLNRKLVELS
ncbi:MAG: hypothetical protein QM680_00930 [Luteolibacter sp.]